jgi:Skp family chaperone for outer membrane proteins
VSLRFLAPLGVLGLAMLIGVGALAGHAGQNEKPAAEGKAAPSSLAMAVVDMDRLYTASGGPQALQEKLIEIGMDIEGRLNAIQAAPFLDRNERLEYVDLVGKEKPDMAQQARLNALKALSEQRAAELQTLQVTKPLNQAQTARLQELIEQQRALAQVMPGIQEAARLQQSDRAAAFRREQLQQLRGVVAQVAREKGFANVFDANALVYSTNDLTSFVLQKLNKRAGK